MISAKGHIRITVALVLVAGILGSGCATTKQDQAETAARRNLSATEIGMAATVAGQAVTGRVLSYAETGIFYGDVEILAYSIRIEPDYAPGTQLVVISLRDDCPRPVDQRYSLVLQRQSMAFAIRKPADELLTSDLRVIACRPIGT